MADYGTIINPDAPLIQSSLPTHRRKLSPTSTTARRKNRTNAPPKKNPSSSQRGVFGKVFSTKSIDRSSCSSLSNRSTAHSWLYTMLNPRSNQFQARMFKAFIVPVIVIDLIFFIISTEPQWNDGLIFKYAEGVTSTIFLLEYLARLWTIMESKHYRGIGPIKGRVKYMTTLNALVDAFATFPFFIELCTSIELPTLTYLRVFRLIRILKTNAYARAFDALWRVFYYNREIMQVAGLVAIFLVVLTAVLMYYLRPPGDVEGFSSIASTMYIATLMLTGQGGPDPDHLPWYTKGVVLLTGVFSIAVFAIPASMLTWGFEAEAERLAMLTRRKSRKNYVASSDSEWESTDGGGDSTDEEYQKIIAGEDNVPSEEEQLQKLLKAFQSADTDQSGGLNAEEFIKYLKENMDTMSDIITGEVAMGSRAGGGGGGSGIDKGLRFRVQKLEEKMDDMNDKLDQLLAAVIMTK